MQTGVNPEFPCIGITGKSGDAALGDLLRPLYTHLHTRATQILVDARMAEFLPQSQQASLAEVAQRADLLIVVGGDGTLLHSARILAKHPVPVVGINRGRLGFLADIAANEMLDSLDQILQGHYERDERFLLEANLCAADGSILSSTLALNDVVLHKWNTARLIEFELQIDERFVETQRSDGIIIATPTGSTAYALSGGGPLLAPSLGAIVLVPICPHTLSNRPIVVSDQARIQLAPCAQTHAEDMRVTCDGQNSFALHSGQQLRVCRAANPITLIHPTGHDHFQILRKKLGWGQGTH